MGSAMDMHDVVERLRIKHDLEPSFVCCLVRQAVAVLAGKKPAALFCFHPRKVSEDHLVVALEELFAWYSKELQRHDLVMLRLATFCDRMYILLYRTSLMARVLDDPEVKSAFSWFGYDKQSNCLDSVCARLAAYYASKQPEVVLKRKKCCNSCSLCGQYTGKRAEFPHEVGLILGYPPEDVKAYVVHQGKNFKLLGSWKVYTNSSRAQETFTAIRQVERLCWDKFCEGMSLRELITAKVI